ncbi:hypothetical protein LCGC14_1718860 [marine sediment metagenome]|uniref:Uncharacterized protein n=1 Tax=marine sediment metagenome TaxID=412755 RepID=A0A0F9I0Q3_9ZZZZ
MKYLDKLRRMTKHKLIVRGLLLIIILYSVIVASVVFSVSLSVFKTMENMKIPDNLQISLIPEDPLLQASYKINNNGFSDISNLVIDLKVDLSYYEDYTGNEIREQLFFKSETVEKIDPWQNYEATIEGGFEYFNVTVIELFWDNANLSRPIDYLLDIGVTGNFFLGLIPFKIAINDFNPDCGC